MSESTYTSGTVTITGCGEIQILANYVYRYTLYITKIDDASTSFVNDGKTRVCGLSNDTYMLKTIKFTKNISFYIQETNANTVGGIRYVVRKY